MSERDAWQDRRPVDHGRAGIDLTEAEILRRYADRLAAVRGVADARAAIEHHVRVHAAELGLIGLDIREDHAEEGVGTLRIHYAQHHLGLPVLGAGIEVSADIARASVISVQSTIDEGLGEAPEPVLARSLEAVMPAAMAPFDHRYGAAVVVSVRMGYLRDLDRPPLPKRDNHTASHELLRTGTGPDGMLHLVHELSVETTMPFERFRVVVDSASGSIRSIELLSVYITESGSVFLPRQVPGGTRPPASIVGSSLAPRAARPDPTDVSRATTWSGPHAPPPFGWSALRVCSAAR
ncbi:MAG: hypothetical protein ABWZ82_02400 [Candidatus Limnocylindrales bacterium]